MTLDQFKDRLKAAGFVGGPARAIHFSEIAKALNSPEEAISAHLDLPFWAFETHLSMDGRTGLATLRPMGSDSSRPLEGPAGAGACTSPIRAGGGSQGGGPFAGQRAAEDLDAQSRREWGSDANLRGEFPSLESYCALRRAEAAGRP